MGGPRVEFCSSPIPIPAQHPHPNTFVMWLPAVRLAEMTFSVFSCESVNILRTMRGFVWGPARSTGTGGSPVMSCRD